MQRLVLIVFIFWASTFKISFAQSIKLPCSDGKLKADATYFKYTQTDLDSLILLSSNTHSFFAMNGLDAIFNIAFTVDTSNVVKDIEFKEYKVTHAFGDAKVKYFDPVELGNGRRHCQTEIKRLLGLTNGMWVIGTKKGEKKAEKFEITFRFFTDAFKDNKALMEEAAAGLGSQYDRVKVTPVVNMEKPRAYLRQKPYAVKSIEAGKTDIGKLLLIERANNVTDNDKESEELGDLFQSLKDDNRACENWGKCKKSKTALEKKKTNCK